MMDAVSSIQLVGDNLDEPLDLISQLPKDDSLENLTLFRRVRGWQTHMDLVLSERSRTSKEMNAIKELQCKRLVSQCTGWPLDRLDEVRSKPVQVLVESSLTPRYENRGSIRCSLLLRAMGRCQN
jgi:hypothetical protein